MIKTVISDRYSIERIEDWCADNGVSGDWQPVWHNGAVAGWSADLADDDAFLVRLRWR